MLHEACSQELCALSSRSNIEVVARDICTRLYAQDWPRGPELDADVDRHWHIVAAMLEAGLMDETGSDTLLYDFDREMAALRDWRARHPDYVVPPPAPRPKG
jgi:hypothetical protein